MKVFIYGLVNPLNNRVFYVGATSRGLDIRLREHISTYRSYKFKCRHRATEVRKRIELYNKLKLNGLTFRIKLLEVTNYTHSSECEIKWFEYYLSKNFNLFQRTTGIYKNQVVFKHIKKIKNNVTHARANFTSNIQP